LVASGRQQWGTYNGESGAVQTHEQAGATSEDLLEMAAIQTFLNGGTVFTLSPGTMPDKSDLAAVFRY
jgi:hypothetical protein